jgi:hypothetical protein
LYACNNSFNWHLCSLVHPSRDAFTFTNSSPYLLSLPDSGLHKWNLCRKGINFTATTRPLRLVNLPLLLGRLKLSIIWRRPVALVNFPLIGSKARIRKHH